MTTPFTTTFTRTTMLAAFAMLTTFAALAGTLFTRATRTATVSTATRRRPKWPHPLGAHPVHDAVELFDDSIKPAGGVTFRCPLIRRPFLGSPREMHPASHGPQHHHTPGHGQPFPRAIHLRFSWYSCGFYPGFGHHLRGGAAVSSMLLTP